MVAILTKFTRGKNLTFVGQLKLQIVPHIGEFHGLTVFSPDILCPYWFFHFAEYVDLTENLPFLRKFYATKSDITNSGNIIARIRATEKPTLHPKDP